ncbi:MAG: hypothetical protein AAGH15_05365 [Myxococcota bacterium]
MDPVIVAAWITSGAAIVVALINAVFADRRDRRDAAAKARDRSETAAAERLATAQGTLKDLVAAGVDAVHGAHAIALLDTAAADAEAAETAARPSSAPRARVAPTSATKHHEEAESPDVAPQEDEA